ncbi:MULTISPECIES: glutamine--fructose-6-phosphate transaminase (isomerizing) [Cysteiniphilum]|uniref:Glutamine--fructose-6-phosphate aminotransferase [isomerizing] n=1 Tax=Cysteiniphilum litorale TaxID=2056700 RepID=A0A8J2Z2C4_9GAMM|nr:MULTISPECIES: glutamine--fructose-6-phosphate transaminase (isomerizing) [Cysteiniphilum]GGF88931.1 glutamine--fructose-6-phosphate aminotransferase [isomerizing] [Cysteiniphilum litorale]
MCGIVGAVSERNVLAILLEGLKRLEYRGYDSAGVALLDNKGKIERIRALGKVQMLAEKVAKDSGFKGSTGIAHTRWATHGEPSEQNAHPHVSQSGKIAIVHNGIIENYMSLKEQLIAEGVSFQSQTDTEVVAHLLEHDWNTKHDFISNVQAVIKKLKGAYGLAVMHEDHPHSIVVVRSGSPIVIGFGIGENFISSDTLSLLPVTNRFAYLDEGDMALVTREKVEAYDQSGIKKVLDIKELDQAQDAAAKGKYKHYMQKEIFEQPQVIADTFANCISVDNEIIIEKFGLEAKSLFADVEHVKIVACGTSFHAGLVAKYWIEEYAQIPVDVEIASEFRYRQSVVPKNSLFITVSQSGETADTLAALRQAKVLGFMKTLSICNMPNSSMVREADLVFMTQAGLEMGVASTKAFTTQLVGFLLLAVALGKSRKVLSLELERNILSSLKKAPEIAKNVLALDAEIEQLSYDFVEKHHTLFLGRGVQYPVALEGALKLKEISYIHAEAYPAGELKHGPLALVDKDMPIVAVAPNDTLLEKLESNLQEVQARGGKLYVFVDHAISQSLHIDSKHTFIIESVPEVVSPIIFTIPLQLFSYHVAVQKGTDVDQPRNLAKSVTVE